MQSKATSKFVRVSPTKLRPFVNVIRGYTVDKALSWLKTCGTDRVVPIEKVVASAYANAKNVEENTAMNELVIKTIQVDAGPTRKYFKAGAMGRAQIQRKRTCHIAVVLEKLTDTHTTRGA